MTRQTVKTLIRLQSGEALQISVDSNTMLEVSNGTVLLREPLRWLADTVVAPIMQLTAGQCHRVACTGWIELTAGDGGAQVRSVRSLTIWEAVWQTVRTFTRQADAPANKEHA
jgi:hypothetical protein